MELVKSDNLILKTMCNEFDFSNPSFDPIEFSKELVKFMYDNNGIGLAANQVGVPYRIFSMRGSPENFVCFNPKIVSFSDETIYLEEGCLSYPNLLVKIKRPRHIRARYQTPNGETRTDTFTGMTARVFQHEFDHLDGIIFYNKANRFHRERALRRLNNGLTYTMEFKTPSGTFAQKV
jgi:peptide deformylase